MSMKKLMAVVAVLVFAAAAGAGPETPAGKPLKVILSRQSNVPISEVAKNLSNECPNVGITTNQEHSDYMLDAKWWPNSYHFMVIAKGGDTLYATQTQFLHNAVKDVCKYLNTH
jgi:hypothetical protein